MGNVFSSGPNLGKISGKEAIISGLIPIFGQLWARITKFKGSLDKPWLFFPLFFIPPFSFIPSAMMYFGLIKDGEGGKPYDYFMLIPIILSVIAPLLLDMTEMGTVMWIFIYTFIMLSATFTAFIIRELKACDSKKINMANILNAAKNSVITYAVSVLLPVILSYIPIAGLIVTILEFIPLMSNLIWAVFFSFTYILINMSNGRDIKEYCTGSQKEYRKKIKNFGAIASLVIILLINIYEIVSDFSGGFL